MFSAKFLKLNLIFFFCIFNFVLVQSAQEELDKKSVCNVCNVNISELFDDILSLNSKLIKELLEIDRCVNPIESYLPKIQPILKDLYEIKDDHICSDDLLYQINGAIRSSQLALLNAWYNIIKKIDSCHISQINCVNKVFKKIFDCDGNAAKKINLIFDNKTLIIDFLLRNNFNHYTLYLNIILGELLEFFPEEEKHSFIDVICSIGSSNTSVFKIIIDLEYHYIQKCLGLDFDMRNNSDLFCVKFNLPGYKGCCILENWNYFQNSISSLENDEKMKLCQFLFYKYNDYYKLKEQEYMSKVSEKLDTLLLEQDIDELIRFIIISKKKSNNLPLSLGYRAFFGMIYYAIESKKNNSESILLGNISRISDSMTLDIQTSLDLEDIETHSSVDSNCNINEDYNDIWNCAKNCRECISNLENVKKMKLCKFSFYQYYIDCTNGKQIASSDKLRTVLLHFNSENINELIDSIVSTRCNLDKPLNLQIFYGLLLYLKYDNDNKYSDIKVSSDNLQMILEHLESKKFSNLPQLSQKEWTSLIKKKYITSVRAEQSSCCVS